MSCELLLLVCSSVSRPLSLSIYVSLSLSLSLSVPLSFTPPPSILILHHWLFTPTLLDGVFFLLKNVKEGGYAPLIYGSSACD